MGDDTEDIRAQQEKQARERITRSVNEFVDEHPETRRVGKVAEGGKYGHPFHDGVAEYIENNQPKLQSAFMEGFYGQQRDKALDYLRSAGIINASTPTSRINEFLAAWNIPPLPGQESDDVTQVIPSVNVDELRRKLYLSGLRGDALNDAVRIAVHESEPVNVGEVTMVTPSQDDEIVDAEVIEDE